MKLFKKRSKRQNNKQTEINENYEVNIGEKMTKVDFLSFETFGWKQVENRPEIKAWVCDNFPVQLTLNYFNIPPDIEKPEQIEALRQKYRSDLENINGGLIKVERMDINSIPTVECLLKIASEPHGVQYAYSITIPFKDRSYVLKLLALEAGSTGMRESFLAPQIAAEKQIDLMELTEHWSSDPYDPEYKLGLPLNLAEDEKYDKEFPFHPLSLLRIQLIPKLITSISFDDTVKNYEPL